MTAASTAKPFGKYERFGAYHWREVQPLPTRHNAVLSARYRVLLRALAPGAKTILDIGCGDGCLAFYLSRAGTRVVGIDDSLLPLRLARAEFGKRRMPRQPALAAGDGRRLPHPDACFDCVVLADVIEHIEMPEQVIAEAHRVLRPGGQILLTTPRRQDSAATAEYHCQEYLASELAELLGARFSGVRIMPFRPLGWTRIYERSIFGRKLLRVGLNTCAMFGWNPLAASGEASDQSRFADLCASGWKA